MSRALKLALPLALILVLVVAGVVAGCGGDSDTTSPAPAPPPTPPARPTPSASARSSRTRRSTRPSRASRTRSPRQGFTNITYDLQNAEGDMATTASIAQKFAGDDLDLILGVATPTAQALAKPITDGPILFTAVTDPVGAGLVVDPDAPAANVTGVSDMQPVKPILELATDLPSRRQERRHGLQRRRVQLRLPGRAGREGRRDHGPQDRRGRRPATRPRCRPRPSRCRPRGRHRGHRRQHRRLGARVHRQGLRTRTRSRCSPATPTASSAAPSPATASTTTTSASRPAPWPPRSSAARPSRDIPVEFAENLQLSVNEAAATAQGVTTPGRPVDQGRQQVLSPRLARARMRAR